MFDKPVGYPIIKKLLLLGGVMINKKKPPLKKTKKPKIENIYSLYNQEFRFPSIIDRIIGFFK